MATLWCYTEGLRRRAEFSDCMQYRYRLDIVWDQSKPLMAFCMLNPSTADEVQNDPTVERCERRARSYDMGGLIVVNAFAYRSTDPKALYVVADPVGVDNDKHIYEVAREVQLFVCGWGVHGRHMGRDQRVLELVREAGAVPHALHINQNGTPKHPLYVGYRKKPQPM